MILSLTHSLDHGLGPSLGQPDPPCIIAIALHGTGSKVSPPVLKGAVRRVLVGLLGNARRLADAPSLRTSIGVFSQPKRIARYTHGPGPAGAKESTPK